MWQLECIFPRLDAEHPVLLTKTTAEATPTDSNSPRTPRGDSALAAPCGTHTACMLREVRSGCQVNAMRRRWALVATATMSLQNSAGHGKRCKGRTSEAALLLQLRRKRSTFMNVRTLQCFVCRSCRGETERSGQALCPCGELKRTWRLKSAASSLSAQVLSFLRWAAMGCIMRECVFLYLPSVDRAAKAAELAKEATRHAVPLLGWFSRPIGSVPRQKMQVSSPKVATRKWWAGAPPSS